MKLVLIALLTLPLGGCALLAAGVIGGAIVASNDDYCGYFNECPGYGPFGPGYYRPDWGHGDWHGGPHRFRYKRLHQR